MIHRLWRVLILSVFAFVLVAPRLAGTASAEISAGAGLESALGLLTGYDQSVGANLIGPLDTAGVQINWSRGRAPGGQLTAFLPRGGAVVTGGTIFVDSELVDASSEALAALLAHEARHAIDLIQAGRALDPAACLESEIRAHLEQALAWGYLVGPSGRADAAPGLETDLNELLAASQQEPQAIHEWIVARGVSRC